MTTIFLFIKGSKIAQYALMAIAVLGMLAAVRQHYINLGKTKGAETQRVEQVNAIQQDHTSDRAAVNVEDAALSARIADAERRIGAAEARADAYRLALATIGTMQAKASTQVAAVDDKDLHAYNVAALGVRRQGEISACFTASEERAIATAATQYPLCKKANEDLVNAAIEDKATLKDVQTKIDTLNLRFDNEAKYTARLEGYYVQLWNANPPKVKAWKCLRLWSCGRNTLKPPGLSEVKAAR